MITIIDYNVGNLGSIRNMLRKLEIDSEITSDIEIINKATKIILPGVGAFDAGMKSLNNLDLIEILNKKVLTEKIPILGICLGMQLLTKRSEEGKLSGLSWIDAETKKFRFADNKFKIPHMGWNYVRQKKKSVLFDMMYNEPRFYFVHSFYVQTENESDILCNTEYNINFCSAIEKDNILGVQFHPEKSHKFGMKLLKNFAEKY